MDTRISNIVGIAKEAGLNIQDPLDGIRAALNAKPKDIFGTQQPIRRLDKQAADMVEPQEPSPTPNPQPDAQQPTPTSFLSIDTAALLAKQIGNEIYSAYAYYAVAGWFKNQGLDGFKKWADGQAAGEIEHFKKIYDYLLEAGQEFAMPAIQGPVPDFSTVENALKSVLALEKAVTNDWRQIYKATVADVDGATGQLAMLFLLEQQEEEDKAYTLLQRVLRAGPDGNGILTIDHSLM